MLMRSVEIALKYYQSDVDFLSGKRGLDGVIALPFAKFGVEYATFLMDLNRSVMDASSQYNISVIALSLLQWDLFRDQNQARFASVILRLQSYLKSIPHQAGPDDEQTVAQLRGIRLEYQRVMGILAEKGLSLRVEKAAPVQVSRKRTESGKFPPPPFGFSEAIAAGRISYPYNREYDEASDKYNRALYYAKLLESPEIQLDELDFKKRVNAKTAAAAWLVTLGTLGMSAEFGGFSPSNQKLAVMTPKYRFALDESGKPYGQGITGAPYLVSHTWDSEQECLKVGKIVGGLSNDKLKITVECKGKEMAIWVLVL
jgi:hypothetical protein